MSLALSSVGKGSSGVALSLDRCLFSGQVFRWRKIDGGYEGVDGHHWYRIIGEVVESNATDGDFASLFRLDEGDVPVRRIVELEPRLQPHLTALSGLRLMRPSDPVEVFFSFLCSANNHLQRIMSMVQKLARYGPSISGLEGARGFPSSPVIAEVGEGELRAQGFGYRAATITHAAREVVARGGDEWITGLRKIGYRRAHEELTAIKGIGNKLADCICLYGLGYGEAVPIDTHLWQAATRMFFPQMRGQSLTDKRYWEIGDSLRDRFGEDAGWAHLFLYYENLLNWRAR